MNSENPAIKIHSVKQNPMKYIFTYKQTEYFDISKISVIGDFNNWDENINVMEKDDENNWWTEIELFPGEHLYKFVINDIIRMNDPIANLYELNEEGELMSLIIINEDNERLYNNEQYTVHIEKYNMSNQILEEDKPITMWFWMELNEEPLLSGMWSIKLFVDGEFILEDKFNIGNSSTYVPIKKRQNNNFESWC